MQNQEKFWNNLYNCLSIARLMPYSQGTLDDVSVALSRYLWDISVSESFYPAMNILEVALRNELHHKIGAIFGFDWLMNRGNELLRKVELEKLNQCKTALVRDGTEITSDRLVPELSFGFWTSLFDAHYELPIWRRLFSAKSEERIFPALPKHNRNRNFSCPGSKR